MKLWKIRLRNQRAQRKMPFSLFYLCAGSDVEKLRATFETFLGLPIRHINWPGWKNVRIPKVNGDDKNVRLEDLIPDLMGTDADWHAIIPILSLTRTKAKTRHSWSVQDRPRNANALDLYELLDLYKESDPLTESVKPAALTDRTWKNWKVQAGKPRPVNRAYPNTTYLVTQDDVFLPPCMACPRLGYHEAGECFLGDSVCFTALGNYNADARMVKKLRDYDDIKDNLNGVSDIES